MLELPHGSGESLSLYRIHKKKAQRGERRDFVARLEPCQKLSLNAQQQQRTSPGSKITATSDHHSPMAEFTLQLENQP